VRESQPHLGHSVQVVVGSPRVNYTSSRTILLEGSLGPVESFGSMTNKKNYVRNRFSIQNTNTGRNDELLDISALIDIQTWHSMNRSTRIADEVVLCKRLNASEGNEHRLMAAIGSHRRVFA
jgi:hypothetical protein